MQNEPIWFSLLLKIEMPRGLDESFKDLNAHVLPSPLWVRKRTHCSLSDRQTRAAAEAGSCPCSLIASTLPSAVLAVLIAVLPDSTQTRFRGEHVPGTIPSRQF